MKFWTDKQGKELTFKEFMQRWKQGIQEVNQVQQLKISLIGYWIVLGGIVSGIISAIITSIWWLMIVLLGSLIITGVSTLGAYQKYNILSKLLKEVKDETENSSQDKTS